MTPTCTILAMRPLVTPELAGKIALDRQIGETARAVAEEQGFPDLSDGIAELVDGAQAALGYHDRAPSEMGYHAARAMLAKLAEVVNGWRILNSGPEAQERFDAIKASVLAGAEVLP